MKILFLGYGNPGRMDDGLGPAFINEIEKLKLEGVAADSDYQLTIEDATSLLEYETVVFVDASFEGPEPFEFKELEAGRGMRFSSHRMAPEELLALAKGLFKAAPRAFLLAVRGYECTEFAERLSAQARLNLQAALDFIREWLKENGIDIECSVTQGNLCKKTANM